MRRLGNGWLLGLLATLVTASAGAQTVPQTLAVQGVLRDVGGNVVNGQVALTFRLYTAQSGGTLVWQSTTVNRTIKNGLYDEALALSGNFFASNPTLWLEVQAGTDVLPRRQITSVGFAWVADRAKEALVATNPATGLACTSCVQKSDLDLASIKYALSDVAEGPALNVKCDTVPCINGTEIVNSTLVTGDFAGNTIDGTDLASGLSLAGDTTAANVLVKGSLYTGASIGTGTERLTAAGALNNISTLSMSGQLTSTVADGTAPMVVTSRTKVTNLNVDQLDGYDGDNSATGLLNASNLNAGTVAPGLLTAATYTTFGVVQVGSGFSVSNGVVSNSGLLNIGAAVPMTVGGTLANVTVGMNAATGSQPGYLSSANWTTFNNKMLAASVSAPLSGNGTSASPVAATQAATGANGYVSSGDWNAFNGKLAPSGGGGYVQNQISAAQSANLWISGVARAAGDFTGGRLCMGSTAYCKSDWAQVTDSYWMGNTGSKLIYTQDATWRVGVGTQTPATGVLLDVAGDVRANSVRSYRIARTLPTTAGQYVQIGNFDLSNGAFNLDITVTVSDSNFSISKSYQLPLGYAATTDWAVVAPIASTGAYLTNDFELDVTETAGTASLRLRRTAGSAAGTASIGIDQRGGLATTLTEASGTGSASAPATFYKAATVLAVGGAVGIGTVPAYKLDAGSATVVRMSGLDLGDGSTALAKGSNNALRVTTASGWLEIGPQDASYAYVTTDRPQFYFNPHVTVDGLLAPHTNNTRTTGDGTANQWNNLFAQQITLGGVTRSSWPSPGTGTANYIPKFDSTGLAVVNSQFYDTGTNVTIGSTANASKLDVRGSYVSTRDADAYGAAFMQGANGVAYHGAVGTSRLAFGNTTNYERMTILDNGNVGIGTSSPDYKLRVEGSLYGTSLNTGAIGASTISGTTGSFSSTLTSSGTVSGATVTATGALNGASINVTGASVLAGSSAKARVGNTDPTATGALSVGTTSINYAPSGGNWNYTLLLNGLDQTSIGFHDSAAVVGSIRFQNNQFYIGYDDGWGTSTVNLGGNGNAVGTVNVSGDVTVGGWLKGPGGGLQGAQWANDGLLVSSTWQTIPNSTMSFTLATTARVNLMFTGSQNVVNSGTPQCHVGYRWLVDGGTIDSANGSWGNRIHVSNGGYDWWSGMSMNGSVVLAGGAHTVAMQVRTDNAGCRVCEWVDGATYDFSGCYFTYNARYQ